MPLRNNLEDTGKHIWNFVFDFQNGNLADYQINMQDAVAIHSIVEAAETIVEEKVEIYKLLNNTE